MIIVKPETVIRWHRQGFRRFWRWKSRCARHGRTPVDAEVRALVRRMAEEKPTWGAPRVHSEIRMLGYDVSERTVSRYMRPTDPEARQRWMTFLRNHRDCLSAMDFLTRPTVSFSVLYVFFIIHHARREILHVGVTLHPTAAWICQLLREAFPYDQVPRYVIFDRDSKFSSEVVRTLRGMGAKTDPSTAAFICLFGAGGSMRSHLGNEEVAEVLAHLERLREHPDKFIRGKLPQSVAKQILEAEGIELHW